jgi:hypothetical protein
MNSSKEGSDVSVGVDALVSGGEAGGVGSCFCDCVLSHRMTSDALVERYPIISRETGRWMKWSKARSFCCGVDVGYAIFEELMWSRRDRGC